MTLLTSLLTDCTMNQSAAITINGKTKTIRPERLRFNTETLRIGKTCYRVDWKTLTREKVRSYQVSGNGNKLLIEFSGLKRA